MDPNYPWVVLIDGIWHTVKTLDGPPMGEQGVTKCGKAFDAEDYPATCLSDTNTEMSYYQDDRAKCECAL